MSYEEEPTRPMDAYVPPPQDDPAAFLPAKKPRAKAAEIFWMSVFCGILLAIFLPLYIRLVAWLAEWSWNLLD